MSPTFGSCDDGASLGVVRVVDRDFPVDCGHPIAFAAYNDKHWPITVILPVKHELKSNYTYHVFVVSQGKFIFLPPF